ncbi:DNA polymerase I, partial [Bacillus thuringiensis]
LLEKMGESTQEEPQELDDISFEVVETIKEEHLSNESSLYIEMLEENYHLGEVIGMSLHNEKGTIFFTLETALNSEAFKKWAENESAAKYVYNS